MLHQMNSDTVNPDLKTWIEALIITIDLADR